MIWKKFKYKRIYNIFLKYNIKLFHSESNKDILFTQIGQSKNIYEFENLYSKIKINLSPIHSLYCLKTILKFINKTNINNYKLSYFDIFINDISNNFNLYSEDEYIDIIFILRKCYQLKINKIIINKENFDLVLQTIYKKINNDFYCLKILSEILFDLSILRKNTEFISKIILDKVKKTNEKDISLNIITKILLTVSHTIIKGNNLRELVNFIFNNYNEKILNFEDKTKIYLFKIISKINWDLTPPLYKTPNILIALKNNIINNLKNNDIHSYWNIVESYNYLPINFNNDLLVKTRDIIFDIKFANLSDLYLISFYKLNNNNILKPKLKFNQKYLILNNFFENIKNNKLTNNEVWEILNFYKNIDILPELFNKIIDYIINNKTIFINIKIIIILSKIDKKFHNNLPNYKYKWKNKYNLDNLIIDDINKTLNIKEYNCELMDINNMIYIFKNYNDLSKKLFDIIINNFEIIYDNLTEFEQIKFYISITKVKNIDKNLLKSLLNQKKFPKINDNGYYLIDILRNIDHFNNILLELLIEIYLDNKDNINIDTFFRLLMIKDNYNYFFYIKYSNYLPYIFHIFSKEINNLKVKIIFNFLFKFLKKLEIFECDILYICQFYNILLNKTLLCNNIILKSSDKLYMINKLIFYNKISYNILEKYYNELINKNNYEFRLYEINIIINYYQFYKIDYKNDNSKINKIINSIINDNVKNLDSKNDKKLFNSLYLLWKWPYNKIFHWNLDNIFYNKFKFWNYQSFLNLISIFNKRKYLDNNQFYKPIFEKLVNNLNKFENNLKKNDIIFIYDIFYNLNYKNEYAYENWNNIIINTIYNYKVIDIYEIINKLINLDYYNINFYNLLLNKIQIHDNIIIINKILFIFNNKIKIKHKLFEEYFNFVKILNVSQFINLINYKILNINNILENKKLLEELYLQFKKLKISDSKWNIDNSNLIYIYKILEVIDKDLKIAYFIKKYINFSLNCNNFGIKKKEKMNFISLFINLFNWNYKTYINYSYNIFDGIMLTDYNIYIYICNKDYYLNSLEILRLHLLKLLNKDIKIIYIDYSRFINLEDNIERINYLEKLGIPNNKGIYDFKKIDSNIKLQIDNNWINRNSK